MPTLISDLGPEVVLRLQNRTDKLTRTYIWLRDAILDIAGNQDYRDEFVELEVLGPTFNLTGSTTPSLSVQEYAETNLIPGGEIMDATLDILLWRDPPTNSVRQKLNPSTYQESDKSVVTVAPPTSWYRFGGNIGFYPSPDQNYQVQARVLQQHPIANPVQNTTILLPLDWNEILVWAAVERGYMELLQFEKAQGIHTMLFGDPVHPEKPGLIAGRKKKRAREQWRTTIGLRPIVGDYIHR